ncbi:MAG: hypothetical protein GY811_30155 [Myxococcales bacterium]|nr:hypothetical protein [Myxococcales bacterium]
MGIIGHTSVEGFFHEILTEALGQSGLHVSSGTEYYLVGLLGEFASARISDEPMALRLATTEDAGERALALKEIGDTSLYVSGFFAESIRRQLVDVDYYIGMGGAAYRELSHRMCGSHVAEVYAELSGRFPAFVDVLARIRSQVSFAGDDVLSLYQEWMRTKSDWIESKLADMGVLVTPAPDDDDGGYLQ